ncbi:NYN domain-containing protein [Leifsonia poae]|uniref:NYN domain-containing protein n=1 Tax=Leifsonia poae TaxID=110933 RepID=UPI001CBE80DA|nr:NYN domain-containing protein [Leifsonia poae]
MTEPGDGRVAVYIDFDNIVISRYDQVHGRNSFMRDRSKASGDGMTADPKVAEKLALATVDIGAVIDFASSFGTLVLTRAYADWSAAVNADYRGQLVGRAVDLVQLFPAAAYAKNGADIRLAVDAVEDLFRLPDLTHVVIVAGDSDYIALAQRCKRLGRYVVGIGVAGSTSKSLAAACDDFVTYDDLPGVTPVASSPSGRSGGRKAAEPERVEQPETDGSAEPETDATEPETVATEPETAPPATTPRKRSSRAKSTSVQAAPETASADPVEIAPEPEADPEAAQEEATRLLLRAMQLGHEKDDTEWLHISSVKSQIKRMDPSFSEKSLGFRSFSDFIKSRDTLVDLDDSTTALMLKLLPQRAPQRATKSRRAQHP